MAVASAAAMAKEDDEEVYNLVMFIVLLKFSPIALEYNNRVFLILLYREYSSKFFTLPFPHILNYRMG